MAGGFKKSSRFGLIGVFVVAAIIVVIAATTSQGEANPKMTLALIFGVLAVFFVILFALQRADLDRVSRADARGSSRAAAEGGRTIENPMTMASPTSGRRWPWRRSTPTRSRRAARCGNRGDAACDLGWW